MNEQQMNELLNDHQWLMNHSHLLKERFDALPAWALIRQWRIMAEWKVVLDAGQRLLDKYDAELADEPDAEPWLGTDIVLGD